MCVCNINDMCVLEQLSVGLKVLGGDGMQLLWYLSVSRAQLCPLLSVYTSVSVCVWYIA